MGTRARTIATLIATGLGLVAAAPLAQAAAPPNDQYLNAESIAAGGGAFSGTLTDATDSPEGVVLGGRDVWYRWIAPAGAGVTSVELCGPITGTERPLLNVYDENATPRGFAASATNACPGARPSTVKTWRAVPGREYTIVV